jgi:hypothetical protein
VLRCSEETWRLFAAIWNYFPLICDRYHRFDHFYYYADTLIGATVLSLDEENSWGL